MSACSSCGEENPRGGALLQCMRQLARAGVIGAVPEDGHDSLLRRRRLDGAGRAARPRDALACPDGLLRGRQAGRRAARRDAREVHRRRGHGGVRPDRAPRGRCAARRPDRRRDARDAGAPERGVRASATASCWRRGPGSTPGTVAGKGLVPDRNFVAGDTANSAARLQQNAKPGEILLAESTFRLVRESVEAEPVAPLELKGKQDLIAAYRLVAVAGGPRQRRGWTLHSSAAKTPSPSSSGRWSGRSRRGLPPRLRRRRARGRQVEARSRVRRRVSVSARRCSGALSSLRRRDHVLAACGDGQAGSRHPRGDGADDAVAKLEALLAPADDARTVAETIAQLTGLLETRGVVDEGFWAVRTLFASLAGAARSSPCSTTHNGLSRRSSR